MNVADRLNNAVIETYVNPADYADEIDAESDAFERYWVELADAHRRGVEGVSLFAYESVCLHHGREPYVHPWDEPSYMPMPWD